jgi:hypothetical protein
MGKLEIEICYIKQTIGKSNEFYFMTPVESSMTRA